MTDQSLRIEVGIPVRNAAKIIGVSVNTLRLYEADPHTLKATTKRRACERFYAELRRLMAAAPLTQAIGEAE